MARLVSDTRANGKLDTWKLVSYFFFFERVERGANEAWNKCHLCWMLTFELRYINESTESTSWEFPKFFFENFQLLSLSNDNDNDWRKRKLDSSAFRPSCLSPIDTRNHRRRQSSKMQNSEKWWILILDSKRFGVKNSGRLSAGRAKDP